MFCDSSLDPHHHDAAGEAVCVCCVTFPRPKSGGQTWVFPDGSLSDARGEGVHHPAVLLVLPPGKDRLDNLSSLPDHYFSSQFGAFLMG